MPLLPGIDHLANFSMQDSPEGKIFLLRSAPCWLHAVSAAQSLAEHGCRLLPSAGEGGRERHSQPARQCG